MPPTGAQGAGATPSCAACHSTSRAGIRTPGACSRCRMMQKSGLCADCSIAESTSGLYFTTRPGSIPQEAAMMALGLASSIRTASSCAAKPPKTTE
jgi:hypothetical protein